jgi:4-hydroxy-4-methyl-2-oxoglutarate aldolase
VVADDDGVAVVTRRSAPDVLEASKERVEREETVRQRLRDGELGVDIYGLRDKLRGLGVRWVDASEEV